MIKVTVRRIVILVAMIAMIGISACGTIELGMEPAATLAEPAATLTPTQRPAPTIVEDPTEPAAVVTQTNDVLPTAEVVPTPTEAAGEMEAQTDSIEPDSRPSEISSLDDTWLKYTNYELGFSINFPRTMIHFLGSCKWNEENGDHSYRPEPSYVPVKIFEDVDTVFITSEYQHELSGETKETSADGGTRTFFSECEAVSNSLELLRDPDYYQQKWEIVARDVHDDEELDAFLKDRYGSGCSLGEKVASGQEGVFDVTIQGDGKDLSESLCPLNYGTVVKYYPAGNQVIAWDIGQAVTFAGDTSYSVVYDQQMTDSFRFLTMMPDETS